MKTLILVRHAKSSWKDLTLRDRDRPLNGRGKRDAPKMGNRLKKKEVRPQLLVSSPAERALATAKAIAERIGYPEERIVVKNKLYGAGVSEWLEVVKGLADDQQRVMLFGHNPGLTEVVNQLGTRSLANVPTCGVVAFDFDVDRWSEVPKSRPSRMDFYSPKISLLSRERGREEASGHSMGDRGERGRRD